MALKALESRDISIGTFLDTGEYERAGSGNPDLRHSNLIGGPLSPGGLHTLAYFDQKDLVLLHLNDNLGFSGAALMDPLYLDPNAPKAFVGSGTASIGVAIIMGEWDKISGVAQKTYGFIASGDDELQSLDPVNYNFPIGGGVTPYANIGREKAVGAITSPTDIGSYDRASASAKIWEQWGFMLRIGRLRHTDNVLYNAMFLVDLTGSLGTIGLGRMLDVTVSYQGGPTNPPGFTPEAPTFLGDAFELASMQFVADDDDTAAQPKGRIFLWTHLGTEDDSAVAEATVGKLWYKYVKIIDWNPFNKVATPGNPSRVHLRELLLTRMNYTANEAAGTNPTSMGVGDGSEPLAGEQPYFHPGTRTMRTHFDYTTGSTVRDATVVIHSLTPSVNQITAPTALADVETNKTVAWESLVLGDIGEPIAAKVVDWTLERVSTDRENLDTDGLPATSTVDHPVITAGTLVVEREFPAGTFTVLTEGASDDYTVVESSGVITWQVGITGTSPPGPEPDNYFASYQHLNTKTTPAHGSLLQASSQSDVDGRAQTRVRYPETARLVGEFDRLEAETED